VDVTASSSFTTAVFGIGQLLDSTMRQSVKSLRVLTEHLYQKIAISKNKAKRYSNYTTEI
jgi:hypothetical protein